MSRPGPRLVQGSDAGRRGGVAARSRRRPGGGRIGVTFLISAFDRATGRKAWEHEVPAEGDAAARPREAQPRLVEPGDRRRARLRVVRHRANRRGRSRRASPCGRRNLGAEYGAVRHQLGPRAARRPSTRTWSSCCATTTRRPTSSRSTRAPAPNRWKVDYAAGDDVLQHAARDRIGRTGGDRRELQHGRERAPRVHGRSPLALPRGQPLPGADAAPARRRHLHEPRLSQQPVHGDSSRADRETSPQAATCSGAWRQAVLTFRRSSTTTG